MLQILRMLHQPRLAIIGDGETLLMTITGGRNKLVLQVPQAFGAQMRADLAASVDAVPDAHAERPAPPRYKWVALMDRLNGNTLTPADRDALRDLLMHLGVQEKISQ